MTSPKPNPLTFQELILRLQKFWAERGCVLQQPYDVEVGAGTMAPETFLRVLGPQAYKVAYRAAFAPPGGRALRRESQPVVQAHPAAGDPEAAAGECAGALSGVAGRDRH